MMFSDKKRRKNKFVFYKKIIYTCRSFSVYKPKHDSVVINQ